MVKQESPQEKQLRIARLDLENAKAAVRDLPTVEARAQARVDDARERLAVAEADLAHVRDVEAPATTGRVAKLEADIAELAAELGVEA